jgi:hypothetical protein
VICHILLDFSIYGSKSQVSLPDAICFVWQTFVNSRTICFVWQIYFVNKKVVVKVREFLFFCVSIPFGS